VPVIGIDEDEDEEDELDELDEDEEEVEVLFMAWTTCPTLIEPLLLDRMTSPCRTAFCSGRLRAAGA
jgi:hypothetical protein